MNRIRTEFLKKKCILLFSVVSQPTKFYYLAEMALKLQFMWPCDFVLLSHEKFHFSLFYVTPWFTRNVSRVLSSLRFTVSK